MRLINVAWTHPWLDWFFLTIAAFGLWKWSLAIAALALAIWGGFRQRTFLVMMLLCLLIGDAGINWTIKSTVNRPRPHESHDDLRRVRMEGRDLVVEASQKREVLRGNSMTSGHACNNFALATVASLLFRPWGRLLWIWAVLIAYSRVYTCDHYPSDVIVSFFVAVIYATAIVYISDRLWQQYGSRWFPKTYELHPRLIA